MYQFIKFFLRPFPLVRSCPLVALHALSSLVWIIFALKQKKLNARLGIHLMASLNFRNAEVGRICQSNGNGSEPASEKVCSYQWSAWDQDSNEATSVYILCPVRDQLTHLGQGEEQSIGHKPVLLRNLHQWHRTDIIRRKNNPTSPPSKNMKLTQHRDLTHLEHATISLAYLQVSTAGITGAIPRGSDGFGGAGLLTAPDWVKQSTCPIHSTHCFIYRSVPINMHGHLLHCLSNSPFQSPSSFTHYRNFFPLSRM